ncbi:hypothetical protein [Kutzneria buriramensis]|uniref:Uncharacterized protein n=1 Tax=Kutzneria buriramensis TaxID=1045776 RepID=A0A3E0GYI3_9PSEU|nr:hypothetical protein [Kutzneria buriramensis]REH35228.1 hypothetical protein BCF44_11888 [Kutzneria buriramensis]
MSELLRSGSGLSERAVRFLRANATEHDCRWDADEDRGDAEEVAGHYGLAVDKVLARLAELRERFGGLRYESRSWSFEEVVIFAPALDFDEEDNEPRVILLEHTVAHPFGVWATLDGAVDYMFPSEDGADYVRVFDRPESIVEADALHWECADWTEVGAGRLEWADEVEDRARALPLIDAGSGSTEWWWQGDGFRVHVWRTYAKVFNRDKATRWAVWGSDPSGADNARQFLREAGV